MEDESSLYFIEKVFKGSEPIMEMAACLPCLMELQKELSEESRQAVQKEFEGKVDWKDRLSWAQPSNETELDLSELDVDRWLDHCVLTNAPRSQCRDFQVSGLFMGDQIVVGELPYMVSGKAAELISDKLSKKTRDYLQDFVETQFGMPPEFCNPSSPIPALF